GWVGCLVTQGGGLGGLALGYCRAAPSGRRNASQRAGGHGGTARLPRAKPEGKKEAGWGGPLPRAAAVAALPWAIVVLPLRGAGRANEIAGADGDTACLWRANPEGKKRLGGVALYPGRRPRRPCPGLLSCCPFGAPEGRTSKRGWEGW